MKWSHWVISFSGSLKQWALDDEEVGTHLYAGPLVITHWRSPTGWARQKRIARTVLAWILWVAYFIASSVRNGLHEWRVNRADLKRRAQASKK
jgi:hypothetical protein